MRLLVRAHYPLTHGLYTAGRGEGRWAQNIAILAADVLSGTGEVLVDVGESFSIEAEYKTYGYNAKVTFVSEAEMQGLLEAGSIDVLICTRGGICCEHLYSKVRRIGLGSFWLHACEGNLALSDRMIFFLPFRMPPDSSLVDERISLVPYTWGDWQQRDNFKNRRIGVTAKSPFACHPQQQIEVVGTLEHLYGLHQQGVCILRVFCTDHLDLPGRDPIIPEAQELVSRISRDNTVEWIPTMPFDRFRMLLGECSVAAALGAAGSHLDALLEGVCPLDARELGLSLFSGLRKEEGSLEDVARRLLVDENFFYSRLSQIQNAAPLYTHSMALEKMKQALIKLGYRS